MILAFTCIVGLAGSCGSTASYQWTVSSISGQNNVSSIAATVNARQLYVSPGRLAPDTQYTFTCQVCLNLQCFLCFIFLQARCLYGLLRSGCFLVHTWNK